MAELIKYADNQAKMGKVRGPDVQLDAVMLEKYYHLRSTDHTMKETADILGVHVHTLYRWRLLGKQARGSQMHDDLWMIENTIREQKLDEYEERAGELAARGYTSEIREDGTEIIKKSPNDAMPLLKFIELATKRMKIDNETYKPDPNDLGDGTLSKKVELVVSADKKKVLMQALEEEE